MAFLGELVVGLGVDATKLNRGLAKAESSLRSFRGVANRISSDFKKLERAAIGFGMAVSGIGASAVKMAMDFDKGVAEITTLLGGVTENEIKGMKKELMDLAEKTGQALDKLTKARYDIVSAGFRDAAASAKLLDVAARSAVAGVTDVSVTADLLTTVLNAYNISVDKAEEVSDTLFQTVVLGKTTMGELGAVLGRAIPLSAELGVNLEELGATLGVLTSRGLKTDEAVTAVRATIVELMNPSEQLKRILKAMGYETAKVAIKSLGFIGTMKKIGEKAKEMNIPLSQAFNNVRAMQAAFPMATDEANQFGRALESMENKASAMNTAFEIMNERAFNLWRRTLAKLRNMMIELGEEILPVVIERLTELEEWLSKNSKRIKDLIDKFAELIKYFMGHLDIVGKVLALAAAFKVLNLVFTAGRLVYNVARLVKNLSPLTFLLSVVASLATTVGLKYVVLDSIVKDITENFDSLNKTVEEGKKKLDDYKQGLSNVIKEWNKQKPSFDALTQTIGAVSEGTKFVTGLPKGKPGEKVSKGLQLMTQFMITPPEKPKLPLEVETDFEELTDVFTDYIGELPIAHLKTMEKLNKQTLSFTLQGMDYYQAMVDLWLEKNQEWLQGFEFVVSQMGRLYESILEYRRQLLEKEMNDEIQAVLKLEKAKVISAEEAEARIANIREKYRQKELEEAKKMKWVKLAQAISNTALGVTQALTLKPPWSFIAAAIVSAMGATQIAIIKAQPYAYGGLVEKGDYGTDKVPAMLTIGEAVVNRGVVRRYGEEAVDKFAKYGDIRDLVSRPVEIAQEEKLLNKLDRIAEGLEELKKMSVEVKSNGKDLYHVIRFHEVLQGRGA